jgi:hypothetical protein
MPYKRLKLKNIKKSHEVFFKSGRRKYFKNYFLNERYDPRKGLIYVDFKNKIIDGNHRHQILMEKFGEEHTIIVQKTYLPYFLMVVVKIIFMIIYPLSYFGKYKRVKLKKISQSHCTDFKKKDRQKFSSIFLREGYIPKKGLITIGIDNKIINGNHRYCLLLQKFGENHTIIVRKVCNFYSFISLVTTLIAVLLLPFQLIVEIFKLLKRK